MQAARKINDTKPEWVIQKVNDSVLQILKDAPGKTVSDITIACFGLAFKADIDDLRESPAMDICKNLATTHSGRLLAVEPNISNLNHESFNYYNFSYNYNHTSL